MSQREQLASRLGFILLSAGCAIGLGNVWRFPYITGKYGGAVFLGVYLLFLLFVGLPVLVMEFSVGRATQRNMAHALKKLEPEGTWWHKFGIFSPLGSFILMMFYMPVAGWMLYYTFSTLTGNLSIPAGQGPNVFTGMLANPWLMLFWTLIVSFVGFYVCSMGLQKGVERVVKFMMAGLLFIMIGLAVYAISLPGAAEGLKFYLLPDLSKINGQVIVGAMNQAFFTLSLGIGSMAIFGSYIGKERALMGEAVNVAVLDTFVAITSGLIIFPACFAYNIEVDSGPDLLFITLPNVFNNLPGGRFWGSLFFLFMSFAALSTVFAVFECIISCVMDLTRWPRQKTCLVCCVAMLVLVLPCALGWNVLSFIKPFGGSSTIMDLEDFIVSNLLLPLGSLVFVLFCSSKKFGWGWDKFVAEANEGKGAKVKPWMRGYMRYVLPVIMFAFIIISIVTFFI